MPKFEIVNLVTSYVFMRLRATAGLFDAIVKSGTLLDFIHSYVRHRYLLLLNSHDFAIAQLRVTELRTRTVAIAPSRKTPDVAIAPPGRGVATAPHGSASCGNRAVCQHLGSLKTERSAAPLRRPRPPCHSSETHPRHGLRHILAVYGGQGSIGGHQIVHSGG